MILEIPLMISQGSIQYYLLFWRQHLLYVSLHSSQEKWSQYSMKFSNHLSPFLLF
uniref:Uncharacterized protein n=1 Tax=Rhizophora mucronata TaxID=61149 RepID=A0A2P2P642_RHIMU